MEIKENNAYGTTHENTHEGFQPTFQFSFECKEKNYSTIKQQKYSSGPLSPAAYCYCTGYEKTIFGSKLF